MKLSLNNQEFPTVFNDIDVSVLTSETEKEILLNKIKEFRQLLENYNRRGISYYCELGFILALLKLQYIIKCSVCQSNSDLSPFNILCCKKCIANSRTGQFYIDVSNIFSYADSTINHIIKIGQIGYENPKFKKCSGLFTEVKYFLIPLRKQLNIDKEMWR